MLLVGELINTSRPPIRKAVVDGDGDYIKKIALSQVEAGAHYLDINCGNMVKNEKEVIAWLVTQVQEACDAPLCIDSPNPEALAVGLDLASGGQPMANSITAEKKRVKETLPLISKYRCKVVGLCLDDDGMPKSGAARVKIADTLVDLLQAADVPDDDIYLDPLVEPLATNSKAGWEVIEAVGLIREKHPHIHYICGLSNISFGLPQRKVLNATFMVQTMVAGMDSFVLDPTDRYLMGLYYASHALLGRDLYCKAYLGAYRQGIYE